MCWENTIEEEIQKSLHAGEKVSYLSVNSKQLRECFLVWFSSSCDFGFDIFSFVWEFNTLLDEIRCIFSLITFYKKCESIK